VQSQACIRLAQGVAHILQFTIKGKATDRCGVFCFLWFIPALVMLVQLLHSSPFEEPLRTPSRLHVL